MNNVSILGCGWLGKKLAVQLVKKGIIVKGSTTTQKKLLELKALKIDSYLVDISKDELPADFFNTEVLLISITSKNIGDFKRLISKIEQSSVAKVIFISSTSVYPNLNKVMTEKDETLNSSLVEVENLFKNNDCFQTTILRFAGLFGGNRHPGNWFADKKIPQPNGYVNMIHREDCINIIQQIMQQNIFGQVFNACSNHHPTRKEFYINAKKTLGKPIPEFDDSKPLEYKIISSKKLRKVVGYEFLHDDLLSI